MLRVGAAELIILFFIVVIAISSYLIIKKQYKKENFSIGMKWFYFHTYVRIPLGVFIIFGLVLGSHIGYYKYINLLYAIYAIAVLIGLHKRSIWGWKLNILLFFIESIMFSIDLSKFKMPEFLITLIIFGGLWLYPNYVYFKKRIDIFK